MYLLIHEDNTLQQIDREPNTAELAAIDDGVLTVIEVIDGRFYEIDGTGDSSEIPLAS